MESDALSTAKEYLDAGVRHFGYEELGIDTSALAQRVIIVEDLSLAEAHVLAAFLLGAAESQIHYEKAKASGLSAI